MYALRFTQYASLGYFRRAVLADGAVLLAPDVREYFPDSEAVNRALCGLITLVPAKRKTVKRRKVKI